MRISIILLAVGVLFLLAVIALLCLKKLPLRWGVSLILCAAILCGGGTVFLRREQAQRRENYGSIYMALRYLENGRTDRRRCICGAPPCAMTIICWRRRCCWSSCGAMTPWCRCG